MSPGATSLLCPPPPLPGRGLQSHCAILTRKQEGGTVESRFQSADSPPAALNCCCHSFTRCHLTGLSNSLPSEPPSLPKHDLSSGTLKLQMADSPRPGAVWGLSPGASALQMQQPIALATGPTTKHSQDTCLFLGHRPQHQG